MSRRFDFLLLRGALGVALSVSAIAAAGTQAVQFDGEVRFEQGRLVLIQAPDASAQCAVLEAEDVAPGTMRSRKS
jgi:hypothetical protein